MPNSGDWVYTDTLSSSGIWSFSGNAQQMYDEWKQECKRQDQIYELQLLQELLQEQAELERKDS